MITYKKNNIRDHDPLKRLVEKESGGPEFSPMDPPDTFQAPGKESANIDAYHRCIKDLMKEHREFITHISEFEESVLHLKEHGMPWSKGVQRKISDFFSFFDQSVLPHNHREEKFLFTILKKKLKEEGIQSSDDRKNTAIDLMEDDHLRFVQISSLIINLLELCVRLPDPPSRLMVLDIVIEQSTYLIELMRLHQFREDNIVFPLAQKHLKTNELDKVNKEMKEESMI